MAQIFVSHSQRDEDMRHFFLDAFAGTSVKPHFAELEKTPPAGITAEVITRDIQSSNAVFVLLSDNVESLPHTRDWMTWECGTASNKDIWIFEPVECSRAIKVVVPRVNHYCLFEKTPEWREYLRSIIESYDDSHVLPTLSITTGGGALLNEKDRGGGATIGLLAGLVGLALHGAAKPSFGVPVRCWQCSANYRVHRYGRFRCPVCNADSILNPAHEEGEGYASATS